LRAYHGTTSENRKSILNEGFRFDTALHNGKLFGDAIYFTTNKEHSKEFGSAIIEVEIDVINFMFINDKDIYDDLFYNCVKVALNPYKSIEEYLMYKFKALKQEDKNLTNDELYKLLGPICKSTEYRVGTVLKKHLISKGYNGLALLMGDADIDYYELTVYEEKLIRIIE